MPLPYVVRYRANAFVVHIAAAGAFLIAAIVCLVVFESPLWAGFPALVGATSGFVTILTWLDVRAIDHLRIDREALTLVAKDGDAFRIRFTPKREFAVEHDRCCRSITVNAVNDRRVRRRIIADMLDVPRGLTIYGLCDLMNDLSQGRTLRGSQARSDKGAVRRRQDWYREPVRISRLLFLAGSLALTAVFLSVAIVLTGIMWPMSDWVSKPIVHTVEIALSLLFTYPGFRFLVVGRLRDLGESATHTNARGLIWNKAAGSPLRLFLRRGQEGRNEFGPEPKL